MPCDLSGKMSYLQVQLLFWQLSFECVSSEVLICNPQGLLIVLLLVSEGFDSDIWTLKHPMWIRWSKAAFLDYYNLKIQDAVSEIIWQYFKGLWI